MATNFFCIGYHFEKFSSQVAIGKKKKKFHTLLILNGNAAIKLLCFILTC